MNKYNIIKSGFLSPEDIDIINNIKHLAEEIDKYVYDVYLGDDVDSSKSPLPLAYFCSLSGHFVGYMTVFFSSETDINVYACVLPGHRQHGAFTSILNEFYADVTSAKINPACIYFPINANNPGNKSAIHYLTTHNYSISHIEFMMQYDFHNSIIPFDNLSECNLELLTKKYDENNSEMTFWIGDDYIGGCMIYTYNNKTSCIYNYEIEEDKRGSGYGKYGLKLILNYLAQNSCTSVSLHVSKTNKKACNLYSDCGFVISEEVDYYNL